MHQLLTAKEASKLYEDSIKLKEMESVFIWFNKEVEYVCKQGKSKLNMSESLWRDKLGDGWQVFEKELLKSGYSVDKEFQDILNMFEQGKPESIKMVTVSWGDK